MHAEACAIDDLIEQAVNFFVIKAKDYWLAIMDDANRATNTMLQHFKPTIQVKHVPLQQLDSIVEIEWTTLLATQPQVPDVHVVQEFVVSASILTRKWKDWIAHYDQFHT
jgi:hypothetical protein